MGGLAQLKGTPGLRPNFDQLEDRVDGHMLMPLPSGYGTFGLRRGSLSQSFPDPQPISVVAYHLFRWIGKRLEEHNGRS